MTIKNSTLAALGVLSLSAGCVKQVGPEPAAESFKIDAPVVALNPSCATGGLAGCDTTQILKTAVGVMQDLHLAQMSEMSLALRSLEGVLNRKDSTPAARISAAKLSTDSWIDPEGTYPANLELRVQTTRGLESMGSNSVNDMKGALGQLVALAKAQKEKWDSTLKAQPAGLVLPDEIGEQRTLTPVNVKLDDSDFVFAVPQHLGEAHIGRSIAPWIAVSSHVITEPGMRYEVVHEHKQELTAALSVSGAGPFNIVERRPGREVHNFTSEITPADACQKLRGELRFIRADAAVPLRASFRHISSTGGAK
jgi:hypothetical protein